MDIAQGPDVVLSWVQDRFADLLAEAGAVPPTSAASASACPARGVRRRPGRQPADHARLGRRPGPAAFAASYPGVPVLVDNDVNVMALGEYWTSWRQGVDDLLFVKVATGIGCGIVAGGAIHRGADGTAGDLGHVQIPDAGDALCRCGNRAASRPWPAAAPWPASCAPSASRPTTAATWWPWCGPATPGRDPGPPGRAAGGRGAGRGGQLLQPLGHRHRRRPGPRPRAVLRRVREVVYRRSTALATQHLQLARSRLDDRAGVVGCAVTVVEQILSPPPSTTCWHLVRGGDRERRRRRRCWRCGAWSRTTRASGRSTASTSRSPPGRSTAWSARTAPASPRSSSASPAWSPRPPARSSSTVLPCRPATHGPGPGVATIYQELDLVDDLTVADNLFLGHELHRARCSTGPACAARRRCWSGLDHGSILPGPWSAACRPPPSRWCPSPGP